MWTLSWDVTEIIGEPSQSKSDSNTVLKKNSLKSENINQILITITKLFYIDFYQHGQDYVKVMPLSEW